MTKENMEKKEKQSKKEGWQTEIAADAAPHHPLRPACISQEMKYSWQLWILSATCSQPPRRSATAAVITTPAAPLQVHTG